VSRKNDTDVVYDIYDMSQCKLPQWGLFTAWSHHSLAFLICLVICIGRSSPTSSLKITNRTFWYATPHLWNKLSPTLRVCVPYQFDPLSSPSSSLSLYSVPGQLVDLSHGIFHSRLSQSLSFHSPIPSSDWSLGIMTTRCLAVIDGSSIGKCGRLSQPSWLLVRIIIWL